MFKRRKLDKAKIFKHARIKWILVIREPTPRASQAVFLVISVDNIFIDTLSTDTNVTFTTQLFVRANSAIHSSNHENTYKGICVIHTA